MGSWWTPWGKVEGRKRKFCLFRTVECRDVAKLLRTKKFTMDDLIGSSQSLEVVEQRDTKPLIRAKLITEAVAIKTTSQMTCEHSNNTSNWVTQHSGTFLWVLGWTQCQSGHACPNKQNTKRRHLRISFSFRSCGIEVFDILIDSSLKINSCTKAFEWRSFRSNNFFCFPQH